MRITLLLFLLCGMMTFSGCDNDDDQPKPACELVQTEPGTRFFEFVHTATDTTFIAWTADTAVINDALAQLQLPEAERGMHINGEIERLPDPCKGLNKNWSWYFVPGKWQLAEVSIEVCDGTPMFVEDNLSEFTDNVGRYCPWGSYVLREVQGLPSIN